MNTAVLLLIAAFAARAAAAVLRLVWVLHLLSAVSVSLRAVLAVEARVVIVMADVAVFV